MSVDIIASSAKQIIYIFERNPMTTQTNYLNTLERQQNILVAKHDQGYSGRSMQQGYFRSVQQYFQIKIPGKSTKIPISKSFFCLQT